MKTQFFENDYVRVMYTFGKKMLSACYMSVRRPRWINNPALPVASIGSFIETVPDFRKTTKRVSDGPTSHTILEQVPGADLEYILTDFLKERLLRRMLLGESGRDVPWEIFEIFYSLKLPHFWVSESFRQDIGKCSTWNFFPFKIFLFMTDFRKKLETGVDPRLSSTVVS